MEHLPLAASCQPVGDATAEAGWRLTVLYGGYWLPHMSIHAAYPLWRKGAPEAGAA